MCYYSTFFMDKQEILVCLIEEQKSNRMTFILLIYFQINASASYIKNIHFLLLQTLNLSIWFLAIFFEYTVCEMKFHFIRLLLLIQTYISLLYLYNVLNSSKFNGVPFWHTQYIIPRLEEILQVQMICFIQIMLENLSNMPAISKLNFIKWRKIADFHALTDRVLLLRFCRWRFEKTFLKSNYKVEYFEYWIFR